MTHQFEKRVADLFGKRIGLAVNSGSSANLIALASLDLPAGSKVITPACTFSTSAAPIIQLGLQPVFCDVGLRTFVPGADAVLNLVDGDVAAVLLPDLIGNTPDWAAIRNGLLESGRTDIRLIKDSADTIANCSITDISTTSFYPSHMITAGGLGGMVMYNDAAFCGRGKQYRDWGRMGDGGLSLDQRFSSEVDGISYDQNYLYSAVGYNLKMSEMNAAFGLAQLDRLDGSLARRRRNLERYLTNLSGLNDVILPDDSLEPHWLALPIQVEDRLGLIKHLEHAKIQTRLIFAGNITRHPAYRQYLQEFTNADRIMSNGLMVGLHQGMTLDDVDFVCENIRSFFGE